ncbi:hypothetical protein [Vibrio superstes]|uniref:Plasmid recombination enzyme n=1 Tax=Vibrio superstes NBRC 103154 TaxID=1219062 RepID=A0A511QN42_9VIBR|nr:hypothetical protein [Vibrio superstes]GEM78743.1 hypothetical protein VSU01S_09880 [Vibrio superstes NBRC 103154]
MAEQNWIYTTNNPHGFRLNSLSEDKRERYISNVLTREFSSTTVLASVKADYKKYEYKLNKKISSSLAIGHKFLAQELQIIRDKKPENYREKIEAIEGVKRRNQLLQMLDKYMALSQQVEGTVDERVSKVHEAFFKFPHQHGVVPEPKRMANCIRKFYEQHLPDYPIHFIVVHNDERSSEMETGAHPHIFVSTRNRKTGKRDLCSKLRQSVNRYLAAHPTEVKLWNPETRRHETHTISNIEEKMVGGRATAKLQGIVLQDMFMEHVRDNFQELDIRWRTSRKRKVMAFHKQYEDAKKPKSDRLYNLHNLLEQRAAQLKSECQNLKDVTQVKRAELSEIEKNVRTEEIYFTSVKLRIEEKETELNSLEKCVKRVKGILSSFLTPYKKLIEAIVANDKPNTVNSANECLQHHYIASPEGKNVILETVKADVEAINELCVAKDIKDVFNNVKNQMESSTNFHNQIEYKKSLPKMRI